MTSDSPRIDGIEIEVEGRAGAGPQIHQEGEISKNKIRFSPPTAVSGQCYKAKQIPHEFKLRHSNAIASNNLECDDEN